MRDILDFIFAPRLSSRTCERCQAIASPSRSGSVANIILSAFFAFSDISLITGSFLGSIS